MYVRVESCTCQPLPPANTPVESMAEHLGEPFNAQSSLLGTDSVRYNGQARSLDARLAEHDDVVGLELSGALAGGMSDLSLTVHPSSGSDDRTHYGRCLAQELAPMHDFM